jgi:hypothetical protein
MNFFSAILVIALLLAGQSGGFSQGFVNLNFESANVSEQISHNTSVANAIPGWNAYISGVLQTTIWCNDVPLSAPEVCLINTNSPNFSQTISGKYYLELWGEFNPSGGQISTNSAAIGQTGQVPLTAKTLIFWGNIGGLVATFNGQPLNFFETDSTASYNIYSADISAFAGQTGQLLFTDPFYSNGLGGPATLDNIQFSSSPVPEPSALGLSALGGLFLACRRRKNPSR